VSNDGPHRLPVIVLIRATQDALDANCDLATEARGWLGAVSGDLLILLDIRPECLTAWLMALPPLPDRRSAPLAK
jgi:hypothetical protein